MFNSDIGPGFKLNTFLLWGVCSPESSQSAYYCYSLTLFTSEMSLEKLSELDEIPLNTTLQASAASCIVSEVATLFV